MASAPLVGTFLALFSIVIVFCLGMSSKAFRNKFPELAFKHSFAADKIAEDVLWSIEARAPGAWRGWQKEVAMHLMQQNDRKICFIIDEEGGCGKSVLAKILMAQFDCFYCTGGKQNDLSYAYKKPNYDVAIFDLSRNPDDKDFHPYAFAEQLKNGMFSCGKYMSVTKLIDPPKIIWFANQEPDRAKLSSDRYCVHHVSKRSNMILEDIVWNPPVAPPVNETVVLLDDVMDEIMAELNQ